LNSCKTVHFVDWIVDQESHRFVLTAGRVFSLAFACSGAQCPARIR
jgi:hypothetical protein